MKKEDFDLLVESLEQAIDFKKGNKTAARSVPREWFDTDIGDAYDVYDSLSDKEKSRNIISFIEKYFGIKLKFYQKVMLMMPHLWRPND